MKKCTSCAKDLPDTAMHCVFCGAKQAPAPAQGNPNAKTVLGYSAADLLKQAGVQPGGHGHGPAPGGFAPPQAPQQFQPPQAPQGFPPPQAPQPPPQQFQPPPQQFQPPPQQFAPPPQQFQPPQPPPPQQFQPPGGGFQPPGGFPPPAQGGQFGGSASTAATMFMQNAPQIPQQPPQHGPGPQPYQPPQSSFPQMPQQGPQPYPPMGQPGPMGMPGGGMGGMPAPNPYNPVPVGPMGQHQQPPYLASQSAARADKPFEPFNDVIKLVCLIFGGCLLAFFVIPLSLSPLTMTVTSIGDAPGATKITPILIGLGGMAGLALGLMPLQGMQRGLFAAALGVISMLLIAIIGMGGFDWHFVMFAIGGVLVPTGLLLRDKYPVDKLPRLFVFVGAACVGVPFILAFNPIDLFLNLLKSLVHPAVAVQMIGQLVPILLAALAVLLCMIPGKTKFGAKQLAWAWFLFPVSFQLAEAGADGSIVNVLTKGPGQLFAWTVGMPGASQAQATADALQAAAANGAAAANAAAASLHASGGLPLMTAFAAMATFGLCVLFGKQLEMSK